MKQSVSLTSASKISPQVVKIYVSLSWCINQTYLTKLVFKLSQIPFSSSHVFTTFVSESLAYNLTIYEQLNPNLPHITTSAKKKGHFWSNDTEFWRGQRPHWVIACHISSIFFRIRPVLKGAYPPVALDVSVDSRITYAGIVSICRLAIECVSSLGPFR